jgi:hypothetical protein
MIFGTIRSIKPAKIEKSKSLPGFRDGVAEVYDDYRDRLVEVQVCQRQLMTYKPRDKVVVQQIGPYYVI